MDQEVVSSIGKGILVLAAVAPGDTEKEAESLAAKVLKLKLWDDESGGRVGPVYSPVRSRRRLSPSNAPCLVEEKCPGHQGRSSMR